MNWQDLKDNKKPQLVKKSVDGYERPDELERKINKAFAIAFKDDNGKLVLEYLRSITTGAVSGPNVETNRLFHLEGMRFLFAIIQDRINKGKEK
jgi:hypothetical protein